MNRPQLMRAFWLKLVFNLKAEVSRFYLNYLWWILEPVLLVLVFYLVFEIFLDRGGENFLVFLLLGKIPYLWFAKSVNNSARSIPAGRGLIHQMAIPKPFFPLLVVAQDLVKQLAVLLTLLMFLMGAEFNPTVHWLALPLIVVVQLLLVAGVALAVSAVVPVIPDFQYIVNTGMIMLMFASGIFYDYRDALDPTLQELFLLNPLACLIEAYRDALMRSAWPAWSRLAFVAAASVALACLMLLVFRRFDARYARLVIQ